MGAKQTYLARLEDSGRLIESVWPAPLKVVRFES